jgi:hypothetical protein
VGISGGHSPHVQKKNSTCTASGKFHISSLNWLCFSFCFCTKEDPISNSVCACLTPQPVNCHGSMASFSDLYLMSTRPARVTSHHQSGPHVSSCRKLLSGICPVYVYMYMYVRMMSMYHVVCIYDELYILLEFKHKHA